MMNSPSQIHFAQQAAGFATSARRTNAMQMHHRFNMDGTVEISFHQLITCNQQCTTFVEEKSLHWSSFFYFVNIGAKKVKRGHERIIIFNSLTRAQKERETICLFLLEKLSNTDCKKMQLYILVCLGERK